MSSRRVRGGALLMVLWLSAALSAIAFSVALTVRQETARTDTSIESLRAYYLACGAAERAMNYMSYGAPPYWLPGQALMRLPFPEGEAVVEIGAESGKFNVNTVEPDQLMRLLTALGVDPERARLVSMAIVEWRTPGAGGGSYLGIGPSFRPARASFEQIEELMAVRGVTPELFHGGYQRDLMGGLQLRPGLRDCLSVYSSGKEMDVNTANPAVMLALGAPPGGVEQLVRMRRMRPFLPENLGNAQQLLGPAAGRFRMGGDHIYTFRATARMGRPDGRLSDLRRSVTVTAQVGGKNQQPGNVRILAWQDYAVTPPVFVVWPN